MAKDRSFELSALAVAVLFAVVLFVGRSPTGWQAGNQFFCIQGTISPAEQVVQVCAATQSALDRLVGCFPIDGTSQICFTSETPSTACGDGLCDADENTQTCPNDCPSCNFDGLCDPGENPNICPNDCAGGGPTPTP